MAAVTDSITIARTPDEVFAYTTDLAQRKEWQPTVVEVIAETAEPMRTGSRARETRRVTGGPRTFGWELTAYDRPRSWAFRGTDGPVRPFGTMRLSPSNGGAETHVELEIDFVGRGAGKILALLARRDARKQVPRELQQLRHRLEQAQQ